MSNKLTKKQIDIRNKYNIKVTKKGREVVVDNMEMYFKDNLGKSYKEIQEDTGLAKPKIVQLKKELGYLKYNYLTDFKFLIRIELEKPLDNYYLTSSGDVVRKKDNLIIKPKISNYGYYIYRLTGSDNKIHEPKKHRLLAKYFIPNNFDKDCVNHRDGDKLNNSILNLEWSTLSENTYHYHKILGSKDHGEKSNWAKITENQALIIIDKLKEGQSQASIVRELDFATRSIVQSIKLGKSWKHLKR